MNLPEIWYAFQRGWHGSFTFFNALVILVFFYIDRLKVAAPHPLFFQPFIMDLFIFCLSPSVMFPPRQLIPNVIKLLMRA